MDLKFKLEGPIISTDFLDLTLNLESEKYAPFRKANNQIQYIRPDSNHPNNIVKQIPTMISKRLSRRSMNKEEFDKIADPYNDALNNSGYQDKISFEKKNNTNKRVTTLISPTK